MIGIAAVMKSVNTPTAGMKVLARVARVGKMRDAPEVTFVNVTTVIGLNRLLPIMFLLPTGTTSATKIEKVAIVNGTQNMMLTVTSHLTIRRICAVRLTSRSMKRHSDNFTNMVPTVMSAV